MAVRTHARSHTQTCIHMCTSYWSPPHSQICLLLLSKPALKSSIICIHYLHTAASFIPPLSPAFLPLNPSSPTHVHRHLQIARKISFHLVSFFHAPRWTTTRARAHTSLKIRGKKNPQNKIIFDIYERHSSRALRLDDCHAFPPHLLCSPTDKQFLLRLSVTDRYSPTRAVQCTR